MSVYYVKRYFPVVETRSNMFGVYKVPRCHICNAPARSIRRQVHLAGARSGLHMTEGAGGCHEDENSGYIMSLLEGGGQNGFNRFDKASYQPIYWHVGGTAYRPK